MNPNYINDCPKIVGKHNKHENVIANWDESIKKAQPQRLKLNDIKFHLLIAMWFRSRLNIGD
jgi:hypothetical protein